MTDAPKPGVPKSDPICVIDNIHRDFGGITAVDVEHLEIERGKVTALIGPNGAGKTTLFNIITGFDSPDYGRWTFDGIDLSKKLAHQIAREGMVRTFQLTRSLERLTVMENMLLGAPRQTGEKLRNSLLGNWKAEETLNREKAREMLDRFSMTRMTDEYAASLSGGQRKLLELARALMSEPSFILMDEPLAGVNPALAESLLDYISSLPKEGITVMFVEHDMAVVKEISEWVICMSAGEVIAEGTSTQVGQNQIVVDAYLGTRKDWSKADVEGASKLTKQTDQTN